MIVTVRAAAEPREVQTALAGLGLWVSRQEPAPGSEGPVLFSVSPHSRAVSPAEIQALPGVAAVSVSKSPYPRLEAMPRVAKVGRHEIGVGAPPALIAGPCSVDSEERIEAIAQRLARMGVRFLRGGAFKPRTSPYSFQGHGEVALRWMRHAARRHGLAVVTEVMGVEEQEVVAEFADLIQIGSRNMQNYSLLKSVAGLGQPMLLKRGMAATLDEWQGAAEYCLLHGAPFVVFCERGIRNFDPHTRNLLDLSAVAILAHVHRLPVIADPSHAAGRRDLIAPLARGALAVGAHGIMVETHPEPALALSDGPQAILPDELEKLVESLS